MFDNQSAAGVVAVGADAVEGEDESVAELVDVLAQGQSAVAWGDAVRAISSEAIGSGPKLPRVRVTACRWSPNQYAGVMEAERPQERAHRVGVAAAGGDNDLNSGGLGSVEGGEVTGADVTIVAKEGSVHVDGDHADGAGFGIGLQGTPPPIISVKV